MQNSDNIENLVIPEHVAIILDGNGRWAKKRGLPRSMGNQSKDTKNYRPTAIENEIYY